MKKFYDGMNPAALHDSSSIFVWWWWHTIVRELAIPGT